MAVRTGSVSCGRWVVLVLVGIVCRVSPIRYRVPSLPHVVLAGALSGWSRAITRLHTRHKRSANRHARSLVARRGSSAARAPRTPLALLYRGWGRWTTKAGLRIWLRHLPRPQARDGTKHDPWVLWGTNGIAPTCADLHVSAHPLISDVLYSLGGRSSASVVPSVSNSCAHRLGYHVLREVAGTAGHPFGQTTLAPSTGQVPSS